MSATRRTGRHRTRNMQIGNDHTGKRGATSRTGGGASRCIEHPPRSASSRSANSRPASSRLPSLGLDIPTRSIRTCSQRVEGSSRPPSRICVWRSHRFAQNLVRFGRGSLAAASSTCCDFGRRRHASRPAMAQIKPQTFRCRRSPLNRRIDRAVVPSCTDRRPTSWSTCGTTICRRRRRAPSAASRINRRREIIEGVR